MAFRDHGSACFSKSPREGERGREGGGERMGRGGGSLSKSHERRGKRNSCFHVKRWEIYTK